MILEPRLTPNLTQILLAPPFFHLYVFGFVLGLQTQAFSRYAKLSPFTVQLVI